MKYQYHYLGAEGKYFPDLKFSTVGNDRKAVYDSDVLANHDELELINKDAVRTQEEAPAKPEAKKPEEPKKNEQKENI